MIVHVEVHGEKPRPWVLVWGDADPLILQRIRQQIATTRFLDDTDELRAVRQADYDVVIALKSVPIELSKDLFVIQFGCHPVTTTATVGDTSFRLRSMIGNRAERFATDESAINTGVDLLVKSFLPDPGSAYSVVCWQPHSYKTTPADHPPIDSFASEYEGQPLAGMFRRVLGDDSSGELWWLPVTAVPNAMRWIDAALQRWAELRPEVFPSRGNEWATRTEWMTVAEVAAQREVDRYRASMLEEQRKLEAGLEQRLNDLDEASRGAEGAERRLLTSQGDALCDEVASTLREFGFEVIKSDELPARRGDKLEDLRLVDEAWTALVEVKGYSGRKTARTTDLAQIGRAVVRFVLAEGCEPEGRWYIVNQMAGSDPSQRSRPLVSQPDDIAVFAQDGGLIIDTADLFRLRNAVRSKNVEPAAARAILRRTTGVFSYSDDLG